MWPAIGVGSGFLTLLGIVLGMQNVRISKAQTREMCDERHDNIEDSLKTGNNRFEKNDKLLAALNKEQVEQGKVLIEVYTIVQRMEKNGHGP